MTVDGIEMRWLIRGEIPRNRVLQYRLNTRSVNGITGLEFGYTSWEDVPAVTEEEARVLSERERR